MNRLNLIHNLVLPLLTLKAILKDCLMYIIRLHSVYCLVDEVLQCEKIMPGEEKRAIQYFVLFFAPTCKNNTDIFVQMVDKSYGICLFCQLKKHFLIFPADVSQEEYFIFLFLL